MVRSKHRYFVIAICSTKKKREAHSNMILNNSDIYAAVLSKVKKLHGDYGFALVNTGLICKYCNEMTGVAVLKTRHVCHQFVRTVLPFISEIGKENVQLHTIRITSTLQRAYRHLKIHQQRQFEQVWNTLTESEQTIMRGKYENLQEIEKMLKSEKLVHIKS